MKILSLIPLFLCLYLVGCGNEYPVANMPDEPLAQPLEIVIEPKKVAMTNTWAAGVKDDGTLWTWGTDGLLRKTENGTDPTPTQVEGVNDAVAVSGGSHMLLLRKDGSVWGWGYNYNGEIDPTDKATFIGELRKIEGISHVKDIVAGINDSFFLTEQGEIYTIGQNEKGWTNGVDQPNKIPTKIPHLENIVRLGSLGNVLISLNAQGEIYTTGIDWLSLGRGLTERPDHDKIAFYPADKVILPHKVVDFSVAGSNVVVLLETGEVWVWGANTNALLGLSNKAHISKPTKHPTLHQIINVGVGSAVSQNGDLYLWGTQGFGKSENSISVTDFYPPIRIMQNIQQPVELIYGWHTSGIMLQNGEVWFWRDNDKGQRGTGNVVETFYEDYILMPEKSLFTTY